MTQNSPRPFSKHTRPHQRPKLSAQHTPARWAASTITFFFGLVVLIVPLAKRAHAESDAIWSAWASCRGKNSEASVWIEERTIACVDGPIEPNLNLTIFDSLKPGGYVVMRSPGGNAKTAILLSEIVREKDALVILYDYCLSTCADYVLVANRTFVRKDTIVAWRGDQNSVFGTVAKPWCQGAGSRQRPEKLFDSSGRPIRDSLDPWCDRDELNKMYFNLRGLDGRHIHDPQTPHTKRKMESVLMNETNDKKVFWMWNPKNYGDYFKSKVSFDSFPRSQREVDSLVARYRLGVRVVFDP